MRKQKLPKTPPPPPSDAELALMQESYARFKGRRRPVTVNVLQQADRVVNVGPPHEDHAGWNIRLRDAFGTASDHFALQQLNHLGGMGLEGGLVREERSNAFLAVVEGVRPNNEAEAMLAVQMAGTHELAMTCLRRAKQAENIPQMEANGTLATKMLRTYAAQIEALAKLRRGGEQRVVVQHVNVNEGGQAIVGNVQHGHSGGGGVVPRNEHQPHAPPLAPTLGDVPGLPMRGPDPEREAVPRAGGEGQNPLPDARRRQGKRCAGR